MLPDRNIAAKADNRVEAEKFLKKLKEREQKETDVPLYLDFAIIYHGLKDYDKVFYYFKKAVELKIKILFIIVDPEWRELRSDSKYKKLIMLINL